MTEAKTPKSRRVQRLLVQAAGCQRSGCLRDAIAACEEATRIDPRSARAYANLAMAYRADGKPSEALAAYRTATLLEPSNQDLRLNLGAMVRDAGDLDEAADLYRGFLAATPNQPQVLCSLGTVLADGGRMSDAIECFRQASCIDRSASSSNLLYMMHFDPGFDSSVIFNEHSSWGEYVLRPFASDNRPQDAERTPNRRLRVGYVSPHLCRHVVGWFMHPLLKNHDRDRFSIYCYSETAKLTRDVHETGDIWRSMRGLTDEQLAQLISQDRIDILVDLNMHMARNRILVFARKPAPVQVTYLAYCSTTGLRTIDYRLTDPYLDPPGQGDEYYVEKSVRLPDTYWCYVPLQCKTEPGALPAESNGYVTFGCLNNFSKASDAAVDTWCEVLGGVSGSRLILSSRQGSHRERVKGVAKAHGVDPERVSFVGPVTPEEYFELYHKIDVALDPFPYAGGTTTCDALWMGVPVVTLRGRTAVGRGGVSILSNIGLPELIAQTTEQYVQIARDLAGDLPRLSELRRTMRDRMRRSVLMDENRFARNVEAAYRGMWENWCRSAAK